MSGVKILHFLKDLMEIHSNSPKLYYGFNINIKSVQLISKTNCDFSCFLKLSSEVDDMSLAGKLFHNSFIHSFQFIQLIQFIH